MDKIKTTGNINYDMPLIISYHNEKHGNAIDSINAYINPSSKYYRNINVITSSNGAREMFSRYNIDEIKDYMIINSQYKGNVSQDMMLNAINNTIKKYGKCKIKVHSTKVLSSKMLSNVSDITKLEVMIDSQFLDLEGKFKEKYNKQRYIDRTTYTGFETKAFIEKLEYLESLIDKGLPIRQRAYQVYNVLSSNIPVFYDFDHYEEGHSIAASYRGLTSMNSAGKAGLVCAGYSTVFKDLCERCGIVCDYIRGYTPSGEKHAWNVVVNGNEIIPVDATWKASDPRGNYFGPSNEFEANHKAEDDEKFNKYNIPLQNVSQFDRSTQINTVKKIKELIEMKYGPGSGQERLQKYIETGNPNYITRYGNARSMLSTVNTEIIISFLETMDMEVRR